MWRLLLRNRQARPASGLGWGLSWMIRFLIVVLAVIALLYLLYAGYFYTAQRSILFPRHLVAAPVTPADVPGRELLWLETSVGRVEAWYLPPLNGDVSGPAALCI